MISSDDDESEHSDKVEHSPLRHHIARDFPYTKEYLKSLQKKGGNRYITFTIFVKSGNL